MPLAAGLMLASTTAMADSLGAPGTAGTNGSGAAAGSGGAGGANGDASGIAGAGGNGTLTMSNAFDTGSSGTGPNGGGGGTLTTGSIGGGGGGPTSGGGGGASSSGIGVTSAGGGGGGGGGDGMTITTTFTNNAGSTLRGGAGAGGGNAFANGINFSGGGGGGGGGNGAVLSGTGVTNAGTIRGGDGGAGGLRGDTSLDGGGGGGGGNGVLVTSPGAATISNSNTIIGGNGGGATNSGRGPGAGGAGVVGASLTINNTGTISGGLSGDGVTRANAITFTGGSNVLNLSIGTLTGNIAVTGTMAIYSANSLTTLANVITGTGAVTNFDVNTLMLSGANTYAGGTTLSGGVLIVTNSTRTGGTTSNTGNAAGGTETSSSIGTGGLTFDGGTLQAGAVNLVFSNALTFTPNGGTVDANGKTITLAGSMTFGGTGGFTVVDTSGLNTGVVVLTGANVDGGLATGFSGPTTVTSGTLRTGNTYGFSAQSAYTVAAGATLDLNGLFQAVGSIAGAGTITSSVGGATGLSTGFDNTSATFSGVISDGGGQMRLTKYGTGTQTLSGTNTYTGPTSIQGGTLQVAADANLGAATFGGLPNTLTISNGAGLATSASFTSGRSIFIGNGNGKIIPAAGTTLTLTGTIANQVGQPVALLDKQGAGTLTLSGANTYTGGTFLAQGTLAVGSAGALGTGALDFEGGTLQAAAPVTLANAVTLTTPGTVDTNGLALGLSGAISGGGALTKTGVGTLTLSGANTYAGGTTFAAGVVNVGSPGALGTAGPLSFTGGTLQYSAANQTDYSGRFATAAGQLIKVDTNGQAVTFASALTSAGGSLTKSGAGTLTLSGANTYTGGTKVVAGTLALLNAGAIGTGGLALANGTTLAFGGSFALANATALTGTGDPTIDTGANAAVMTGVISGPGALTKIGAGTLTLSAANTYTGMTEVAAGTLVVTGSTASSPLTLVDNAATLGGSGTVGAVTVASGGTLAPGVAMPFSTLSTGNATFASGSTFTVQVNAAGQTDSIKATGTATIQGGTVNVLAGAGLYSPATTYTLITAAGGRTGTFAALTTTSNLAFLTPSLAYGPTTVTLGFAPATTATTTTTVTTAAGTTTTVATTVGTGAVVGTTVATVTTATGTTTTTTVVAPVLFASVAATPNQRASANAIQGVSKASPLYAAVLSQTAAGARLAFDAASGEGHASAATALIEDTAQVREAITGRLDAAEREVAPTGPFGALGLAPATSARSYAAVHKGYDTPVAAALAAPPAPAYALWGSAFGAFGRNGANGNAAALERSTGGFVIGGDTRIDAALFSNWRVGIAGGYTSDAIRIGARATSGTVESYFAGLYAGALYGPVDVKLGVLAGGTSTSLRRTVAFPGFIDATRANYGGTIVQGFGELGYRFSLQRGFVEPVLQAAAIHLDQDRFREIGGAAALNGFARSTDVGTTTLGLKGEVALSDTWPIVARGLIGYRHAFGDVNPKALLAFASGSTPFTVTGAPIDRDALATELGLDWRATQSVTLGLSYAGQYGARASDSAIRGRMEVKF